MPLITKLISTAVLAASTALAIDHDAVEPFPEIAPLVFRTYKPLLKVHHGCVPFPAVNEQGEVGGGLQNTGSSNGKCSSSEGQVYGRAETVDDMFAIMYAWYMPKDQPLEGSTGHRHEWESIVVWLSERSDTADVLAVSYSGHGGYTVVEGDDAAAGLDGKRPCVGYYTNGFTNHELSYPDECGGSQPLIDWAEMGGPAREALRTYDFGDANCPFNDNNFENNLNEAHP